MEAPQSPPASPDDETAEVQVELPTLPADVVSPAAMKGSLRIFKLFGTNVYIHWSWFIAAYFLIQDRPVAYSSMGWDVAEYVAGFVLVLLHEFGHVVGCRLVGGTASRVILWPLGGLAYVSAPPRPWADFWTTLAGPLVNLVFAPVLIALAYFTSPADEFEAVTDLALFFNALAWFNLVMLVFNLLPIYPMDGGRLLQAVLWRWIGRSPALAVAAGLGFVCAVALGIFAVTASEWWILGLSVFLGFGALGGVMQASLISKLKSAEPRPGLACPNCQAPPPRGNYWRCNRCLGTFDLFSAYTECSKGGNHTTDTSCPNCNRELAPRDWLVSVPLR